MRTSSRSVAVTAVLMLTLAACGGDGDASDTSASNPPTAPAASDTDTDVEPTTTAAQVTDDTTGGGVSSAETSATLTLDGETYTFGMGEGASCDTARLGFLYEAQLHRVDEAGARVGEDGILLVFDREGRGTTVSVSIDGSGWTAGEGTGGGSPDDSYNVDGQSAEASLLFVNEAGDEVVGTIDVFCGE